VSAIAAAPARGRRAPARAARLAARTGGWLLLGLAAGLVVALLWSVPFGGRALTVLSGSMAPAIETGDVVVTRAVSPADVRLGDVITFRDPADDERLVTHRVKQIRIGGGEARFVTKGDANNTSERWSIPADGTVGLVTYRLPRLGYLLVWLGHPFAKLLLLVVPALLLGAYELRRLWAGDRTGTDRAATG
jgi:signal peptidase I